MANSRSRFIKNLYQKQTGWSKKYNGYGMTIDLKDYDVDRDSVEVESRDMPFVRAALLDRHLEELGY